MKSIEIENIRSFASELFAGHTFDDFLAVQADFVTSCRFNIDGHLNEDFLGEDIKLPENAEGITYWKKQRPLCFDIIKGRKVPVQFMIVFKMPGKKVEQFISESGINCSPENINGLFLNVNFKQGKLYCTTGITMTSFSLDKSIEVAWDDYMLEFLKQF